MADIKLSDIFGGVGGMSDQVIKNRDDIVTLKTDVSERLKKSGDTMTGTLNTPRIIDTATNIGKTETTYTTLSKWDFPVGASMFVKSDSTGRPSDFNGGYWTTLGRRDSANGYAGILIEYNTNRPGVWIGKNETNGSPSWQRVYTTSYKPTSDDVGALTGTTLASTKPPLTSTAGWHIIARVTLPQSAATAKINITGGTGFNTGNYGQCNEQSIVIRSGNNSPKGITVVCYSYHSASHLVTDVAWKYVSGEDYDIYVKSANYGSVGIIYSSQSTGGSIKFTESPSMIGTDKPAGVTDGYMRFIYHSNGKPTASDVGALALTGGTLSGTVTLTSTHADSTNGAQIQHFGNGTAGNPINIRSMRENNGATWVWEKVANGQLKYSTGTNGGGTDKISLDVSNGHLRVTGEVSGTNINNYRMVYGGYGVLWHQNGSNFHLLMTNKDEAYGNYNSLRPMTVAIASGNVTFGHKITTPIVDATGTSSGQGLVYNGKTAIGGSNDTWLRINPHSQFSDGIYGGPTGALRHDGSIQRGGWGGNTSCIMRAATDGGWGVNGSSAFSYIQTNSNSAHWLIGSYKDSNTLRSGIHVLTSDSGTMRFYTNLRNSYVQVEGGNLTAQNNVVAYSDIRVKKNIEVIQDALNKTLSLRGVTYDRTDQDNIRQTGLIAQEVEAVIPEAVLTSVNGDIADFKSVAYGNLVGLLVESIRELNNKIERLESLIKE